jgi:UDP-N-acetylglucosamine acyltransferase
VVGDGSVIAPRATLERDVTLGQRVKVGIGSVLGGDPQDLKYRGEDTRVEIGDDSAIREYVTINRATSHSWVTKVGRGCFVMSYVHLAHDCQLGDGVMISNGTQLAGHVVVEDRATISGLCAAHQFVRIGAHAFVGGCSRVAQDVPPYVKAVGNPVKLFGLNSVGLQRSGFAEPVVKELKRAYRLLFRSEHNVSQGLVRARAECEALAEVTRFLDFIEQSERGVGF